MVGCVVVNLFFDTETTGINRREDYLVQLAWILTDGHGRILEEKEYIVRPKGYEIPWRASEVHGITTQDASRRGVIIGHILHQFTLAAEKADNLIAHNISFDYAILETAYKRENFPFPLHGKTQMCTMMLSVDWCRLPKVNGRTGFKRPKLEELYYKLFGKSFDNAHDALADTKACMKSYFELVKKSVITPPKSSNHAPDGNSSTGKSNLSRLNNPLQYLVCSSCRELVSAGSKKCQSCGGNMSRTERDHSESKRSKPQVKEDSQRDYKVNLSQTSTGVRCEKVYQEVTNRGPNEKGRSDLNELKKNNYVNDSDRTSKASKMDEEEYSLGYSSGFKCGVKKGHETGYDCGYDEGYEAGVEAEKEEGYEKGYDNALNINSVLTFLVDHDSLNDSEKELLKQFLISFSGTPNNILSRYIDDEDTETRALVLSKIPLSPSILIKFFTKELGYSATSKESVNRFNYLISRPPEIDAVICLLEDLLPRSTYSVFEALAQNTTLNSKLLNVVLFNAGVLDDSDIDIIMDLIEENNRFSVTEHKEYLKNKARNFRPDDLRMLLYDKYTQLDVLKLLPDNDFQTLRRKIELDCYDTQALKGKVKDFYSEFEDCDISNEEMYFATYTRDKLGKMQPDNSFEDIEAIDAAFNDKSIVGEEVMKMAKYWADFFSVNNL